MIITTDQAEIDRWLKYGRDHGWYIPGRILEQCFQGQWPVWGVAVEPDVGWVVAHDFLNRYPKHRPKYSGFTEPAHRRQGWCHRLYTALLEQMNDVRSSDPGTEGV